ncbi:uncharacterized protein DDB_G0282865-like [Chrysoperla carnea]|uniref:uncharacterized protein DDB_G0282865-like n=1 Tax=Chrysoperla carnea TaxID=189513 RepID=UPI001D07AECC|nr:uncharacterized protein DDB_G0282865-like [Chrysoperla carnea]
MTDIRYPEDIVNNMSLTELQNCDWDALFNQIQHFHYNNNNYIYPENVYNIPNENQRNFHMTPIINERKNILGRNHSKNIDNSQDIVISRKPIFIPLDNDNLGAIRKAIFLDSKFDYSEVPSKQISKQSSARGIYDCKICDEKFQTRSSLITHVKVHQQPFCVLCLSPFKTISGYNIHNSKLHSNTKQEIDSELSATSSESDDEPIVTRSRTNKSNNNNNNNNNKSKNNFYDMYNNLNTITLTSKYGRRRKVLDMTTVINKKTRKSK